MNVEMPTISQRMLSCMCDFISLNEVLTTNPDTRMALSNALTKAGDVASDNESGNLLYEAASFVTMGIDNDNVPVKHLVEGVSQ